MNALITRYATALTIAFFIVLAITGTAMFFHLGGPGFRVVHNWFGPALVLAVLLHLVRNWRPFLIALRRLPTYISLVIALIAAAILAYPVLTGEMAGRGSGSGRGRSNMISSAVVERITAAPISVVAGLLRTDSETLSKKLAGLGVHVSDPEQSLGAAATASGHNVIQLLGQIIR